MPCGPPRGAPAMRACVRSRAVSASRIRLWRSIVRPRRRRPASRPVARPRREPRRLAKTHVGSRFQHISGIPMRRLLSAVFVIFATVRMMSAAPPPERIVVSSNHRFLQYQDGKPFFWLADTAWLLFEKLDRINTEKYLEDRRRKGFTVVQAVLLHGADEMNPDGSPALVNSDPGKPNLQEHGYWDHVDRSE